ncbi:MAG: TonB-dependent receptor [Steroidobacteraceae bacterium]
MKIRSLGWSVAVGVASLSSAPLSAQDRGGVMALEEVVVTATKREEKLHDVAMSITALGGADLQQRQLSGYNDFAAQVPGLAIQAIDAGTNRVILRGQNTGGAGATIATTVDDIPFYMSGAQANGAYFSANIDTFDLRRIEVLRGPQGTLYGAAAEGGLIKYVTNPPNLQDFQGSVALGGITVDGGSSAGIAKGMVNLPFWSNKAALRVSAVREGIAGWINNTVTGRDDANSGRKYSVRASLLAEPIPDLSIRLTAFNQSQRVDDSDTVQVVGAATNPLAPPANQFSLVNGFLNAEYPNLLHNDLKYYAMNLEYRFSAATLTSATSYGRISNRNTPDLSNQNLAPGVTLEAVVSSFGIYPGPIAVFEDQEQHVHKFNQELRIASNPGSTVFGHALDWQGGAFFTRETTVLGQPVVVRSRSDYSTNLSPSIGGAIIPADYKEWAIFADLTYHFSPAFDVEVGGRTTHNKQHSQVTTFCCVLYGPTDTTFPQFSTSQNSTTWSFAPRWHINEDVLLYGRIATGFRPGGPNLPVPQLPNPPAFLADRTTNYELGLRADLLDHQLSLDVAVFDIEWKDVQVIGLVPTSTGPVGINGNSGRAKSRGLEWNFNWRPLAGLSFNLLGAYTDAKLTTDAPGLGGLSGDKLPYVPTISATLNADYTWHAIGEFSGILGASWTHTGTRYSGFSSDPSVETHAKLPTFNTLQLRAGLDNGHYNVQVYADNLTNARGLTQYVNMGGANQTGQGTFIRPRTLGIELGARF